jgi:selenocysteine-specific elongation factor
VRERLAERARTSPLDPGLPLGELLPPKPWAAAVASLLHVERRGGKAYAAGAAPKLGDHAAEAAAVMEQLAVEDLVRIDDRDLAGFLEAQGTLKRVGDGLAVPERLYERGRETLQGLSPITLAGFRDALGVSRRTAQLLLERFDADGLTRRVGDERMLRRSQSRR